MRGGTSAPERLMVLGGAGPSLSEKPVVSGRLGELGVWLFGKIVMVGNIDVIGKAGRVCWISWVS